MDLGKFVGRVYRIDGMQGVGGEEKRKRGLEGNVYGGIIYGDGEFEGLWIGGLRCGQIKLRVLFGYVKFEMIIRYLSWLLDVEVGQRSWIQKFEVQRGGIFIIEWNLQIQNWMRLFKGSV